MNHYSLKTKYNTEGPYDRIETHTVYAFHNLSDNYVAFYDHDGTIIMIVPNTMKDNILDAINRLYAPFDKDHKLAEGIEHMSLKDQSKCMI